MSGTGEGRAQGYPRHAGFGKLSPAMRGKLASDQRVNRERCRGANGCEVAEIRREGNINAIGAGGLVGLDTFDGLCKVVLPVHDTIGTRNQNKVAR